MNTSETLEIKDLRIILSDNAPKLTGPANLEVIDGIIQMTEADILSVLSIIEKLEKDSILVEIGSSFGHLTTVLGEFARFKQCKLFTIDNFVGTGSELESCYKKNDIRAMLERNLKNFGIEDFVTIIEGDSAKKSNYFKDKEVDFVFIDGDHRYSQVKEDIMSWFPKIKTGGTMAGHDYTGKLFSEKHIEQDTEGGGWIHHGVNKAVSESFSSIIIFPDTIWCAPKGGK